MTLRDHRLTAAARTWDRAQLLAATAPAGETNPRRLAWLSRQRTHLAARARHAAARAAESVQTRATTAGRLTTNSDKKETPTP